MERRRQTDELHDSLIALTTKLDTALNIYKFWALILIPLCAAYIVYEYKAIARLAEGLTEIRSTIAVINEHGSKHLVTRAQRDHFGVGCHFKGE